MKFIKEDQIGSLSYERKNLVYSERQLSNFEREINVLEGMFKGKNYRLGSATNDHFHIFHYSRNTESSGHNPILQILMHDLDTAFIIFLLIKTGKQVRTSVNFLDWIIYSRDLLPIAICFHPVDTL